MRCSLLITTLIAVCCTVSAQTNLPLGLPADQLIPTKLEGYRLVSLDRKKTIILETSSGRVHVEIPLYVYLPERDYMEEMRIGLKAIYEDLSRMASSREPIDPQRLMTLFLALDRLLAQHSTVQVKQGANKSEKSNHVQAAETAELTPEARLDQAIATAGTH